MKSALMYGTATLPSNASPTNGHDRRINPNADNAAVRRAYLAAVLYLGKYVPPQTIGEAAVDAVVSTAYANAMLAVVRSGDEKLIDAVLMGEISLNKAAKSIAAKVRLVRAYRGTPREQLPDAAKVIGTAKIWDDMIAPSL